jgi:hypothetical protein
METRNEERMLFKVIEFETQDKAHREARQLSKKGKQKEYPADVEGGEYLWLGARWAAAAAFTDGDNRRRYVVIASIREPLDQAFDEWAAQFDEERGDAPFKNQDYEVEQYFKGGRPTAAAKDGMP